MPRFIPKDGELFERIRHHRWEDTPLASWPQSLRTLVSVMLEANQPMFSHRDRQQCRRQRRQRAGDRRLQLRRLGRGDHGDGRPADHSQKMTAAARAMAEKKALGERS